MLVIVILAAIVALTYSDRLFLRGYRHSVTAIDSQPLRPVLPYEAAIQKFHAAHEASRARFHRERYRRHKMAGDADERRGVLG
ncbi:hypothetical protein [Jongsikchunia kroppenstedtii]|uniref:hypothetical protein n=1 Tax=Jongsikchunia kroppenstedtii TaxID=1121721 RepID=UPI0003A5744C|nr:hypothetical protein [Jongsikchunia kroppenstedtii]